MGSTADVPNSPFTQSLLTAPLSEPSRVVRVCLARDIKAIFPSKEESGETTSRFYDPGAGIEIRNVRSEIIYLGDRIVN
jgi:hypothetical protein